MKLIALLFTLAITGASVDDSARVRIARKKLYAAGNVSLFVDGKFFCELSNNSFTIADLPSGSHKFACQWDGKELKKAGATDAVELSLINGAEYYLTLTTEERGIKKALILQEVTLSTWEKTKVDLSEQSCK